MIPTAFRPFSSTADDQLVAVIRVSNPIDKDKTESRKPESAFILDFRDGKKWQVNFLLPAGTESATVRLDRLWFYSFYAAQIDALDFQILAVNNANLSLEKKRISVNPDSLY